MAIVVITPEYPDMQGNYRRELRRKSSIEDHIKRIRSASLKRYGPDIFSRSSSMSDLKNKKEENLKTSKSDKHLIPKISQKGNQETTKKAILEIFCLHIDQLLKSCFFFIHYL